ncbi:MAG: TetR/AcrR family transcriptional regulator [Fidelibacterota bacterium]
MISDRQVRERERRKERILSGALQVFKENGLAGATMDEIAKISDFGKATLYYYFGSKEEILSELLERGWARMWESVEPAISEQESPKQTFIQILNILGALIEQDRVLFEFLFTAPQSMPDTLLEETQNWKKYQKRLYGVFQELLEEGMNQGEFPTVRSDLLLRAIGGLFHGLFFLGKKNKKISPKTMEEFITTFMGSYGTT